MKRILLSIAVLFGLVAGAEAINSRARTTFDSMFDSSGYLGFPSYTADPFSCDSTHTPSASKPLITYYNRTSGVLKVCNGTAWYPLVAQGSTGTAGSIVNADVSASAAIVRSKLATDLAKPYGIAINRLMQPTGIPLVASETAGTFNISVSSNVIEAQAEVTDNETEVSVVQFQYVLPAEYVSEGAITVRLPVTIVKTGSAVNNGSTIDLSVYKQASGAVGSDLVSTNAQTFAAVDTYYNKDFTVTATGLAAGDVLNVVITSSIIDSEAGAGTLRLNMDPPVVYLDVKG